MKSSKQIFSLKGKRIWIAGHNGMVGSAVLKCFKDKGYKNIITASKNKLNLLNQKETENFFIKKKPDFIIIAAARVGGILANKNYKANFIYENFSPHANCDRMYLTNDNALKIDFMRNTIDDWLNEQKINQNEYFYLLSAIISAVPFVSNIAGTYGAYLKTWDKRSFKTIKRK